MCHPGTPGEKTSMFFRRLSAFLEKQSFEAAIHGRSKNVTHSVVAHTGSQLGKQALCR
jgi:hypothetical protein